MLCVSLAFFDELMGDATGGDASLFSVCCLRNAKGVCVSFVKSAICRNLFIVRSSSQTATNTFILFRLFYSSCMMLVTMQRGESNHEFVGTAASFSSPLAS